MEKVEEKYNHAFSPKCTELISRTPTPGHTVPLVISFPSKQREWEISCPWSWGHCEVGPSLGRECYCSEWTLCVMCSPLKFDLSQALRGLKEIWGHYHLMGWSRHSHWHCPLSNTTLQYRHFTKACRHDSAFHLSILSNGSIWPWICVLWS